MSYIFFRKCLLVFPEDTQEYIENEIKSFAELNIKILGTCNTKLNQQKAQLLAKKRRKFAGTSTTEEDEHKLMAELASKL